MNKPFHPQANLHQPDGSVEVSAQVTPADIPDYVMDNLARALIDAARQFYSDPENVRKYEEWKARKEAEAKAQTEECFSPHDGK